MATMTPIGTEIAAHTSPCNRVPTIAWYAPPPATDAVIPACECVRHAVEVIALIPLATTEYNTHSRGTKAMNIASETDTVAMAFEARRRGPSLDPRRALRGRSKIEIIENLLRFCRQRRAPGNRPQRSAQRAPAPRRYKHRPCTGC